MMTWWYFVIPLISAFVGWVLTSIALKIYISRFKKRLLEKTAGAESPLIASISSIIANELTVFGDVENEISDPSNFKKILPVVEEHIDVFLREKLKKQLPAIGSLIGERTILQLKEIFIAELEELFPIVMKSYAGTLKQSIDVDSLVASKLKNLPLQKIESTMKPYLSVEVLRIKLYGTILGLLIGSIQVVITCCIS